MEFKANQFVECRDGVRARIIGSSSSEYYPVIYERINSSVIYTATTEGHYKFGYESHKDIIKILHWHKSWTDTEPSTINPGEGWRLLKEGESKKKGDMATDPELKASAEDKWWFVSEIPPKSSRLFYRRRIEPPYVPWTIDTCPVGAVCTSLTNQRGIVTLARDNSCVIGGAERNYKELLESGITCNGKPCGTEVD